MNKLKLFIEDNFERFSDLDESEVLELDAHYMDDDIVNYLKDNDKFEHNGIYVYYVKGPDEVHVENLNVD
jgi:hypothetical protein